jgi:uncharacterized membrane protein YkoI
MRKGIMRQTPTIYALLIACAFAAVWPVISVRADDKKSSNDERESAEEVYAGAKSGEILPLAKILAMVRKTYSGEIVETKFEHKGDALIYEIYFLDDSGRRQEIYVDARTGAPIEIEGDD